MDLVVDLNFRMDTSALYCGHRLPAATWYEKEDLNTTDMHSFIHPLSAAIAPVWESKTDWDIFRELARVTGEAAKKYLSEPQMDIVTAPLSHDSVDEISQPKVQDWYKGECEAIPGKTMHKLAVVRRDYTKLYEKFIALGENVKTQGLGAHGNHYLCVEEYDQMLASSHFPVEKVDGKAYPSLKEVKSAINAILHLSTQTNGALTVRAYQNMEKKTGLKLADLGEGSKDVRINYADLQAQPRRYNNSPLWSGLMTGGRAYSAYTYNVERLVPWRTLTGRQHFYLDHEMYIAYRRTPADLQAVTQARGLRRSEGNAEGGQGEGAQLPHPPRQVENPFDLWRHVAHEDPFARLRAVLALRAGRGRTGHPGQRLGRGLQRPWRVLHRACVSARIPRGVCIVYHVPERTVGIPKSQVRGNKRAGGHNSFTRVHLKPNFLCGGYGQFTYHFNYWGPTGFEPGNARDGARRWTRSY